MIIGIMTCLFINSLLMSTTDLFSRKLYNTNNLILLIVGILNLIVKPESWIIALTMFLLITLVLLGMFFFGKEGTIGGGDVKMMAISMLFLNSEQMIFNYLILLSLFSLIGIITIRIRKEKLMKYGLVMAPALVYSYALTNFSLMPNIAIITTFALLQITSIIVYKIKGGGNNEKEKVREEDEELEDILA